MNAPALERAVGLFVLGGLLCLGYFTFQLGSHELRSSETYSIEARFTNVAGLTPGAQILIAGVPIGTVGTMSLGKDFSALVELRIRKDIRLSADTMASVRSHGLLGDQYVSLTPGADDRELNPGERITDTEASVDLVQLLGKVAFGSVGGEKKQDKPVLKPTGTEVPQAPAPSQP